MSFLFSSKNRKETFLIIAVLEQEILSFLVEVSQTKTFVASCRKIQHGISLGNGLNVDKLRKFKKTLNTVLDALHQDAQKHFKKSRISLAEIFLVYGAPWFFSEQVRVGLEGSNILVSKEELEKEIKNKFAESAQMRPSFIEQSLNQVKLNGYALTNPFGKRADEVEALSTAISIFPEMEEVLKKTALSFFKAGAVTDVSLPKACALCALNNKLALPSVFLFIDKNQTTAVEIWQNGSYSSKIINYGAMEIIKTAAEIFGVESEEVAASYLRLSKEKILAEDLSAQVNGAIKENMVDWQFQVKNAISDFTKGVALGSAVAVCPTALKNFFRDFIADELPAQAAFKGLEELEEIVSNPLNLKFEGSV